MKVKITKSNTRFVSVGEITDVEERPDGTFWMWSEFCRRYEKVSWVKSFWGVEYEQVEVQCES